MRLKMRAVWCIPQKLRDVFQRGLLGQPNGIHASVIQSFADNCRQAGTNDRLAPGHRTGGNSLSGTASLPLVEQYQKVRHPVKLTVRMGRIGTNVYLAAADIGVKRLPANAETFARGFLRDPVSQVD